MKTKSIYVVCQETFWAGSGTSAIATFTNKQKAQEFADKKEDRTDLRNGSQCFIMSRTDFNKKYGSNCFKIAERYMIEKDGSLTTPGEYSTEAQLFENNCEL